VLAVPGSVLGGRNRGGHALIRDGARIVESARDVVEELRHLPRWAELADAGTTRHEDGGYGQEVLGQMRPGEARSLDELAAASGLDSAALLAVLGRLEVSGRVRRLPGGGFLRV
jgi:DNA processing protein